MKQFLIIFILIFLINIPVYGQDSLDIVAGSKSVTPGEHFRIPILMPADTTPYGITGFQISLAIDRNVAYFTGISRNGTLIDDWSVNSYFNADSSEIEINGFDFGNGLTGSGVFVYLLGQTVGDCHDETSLTFTQTRFSDEQDQTIPVRDQEGILSLGFYDHNCDGELTLPELRRLFRLYRPFLGGRGFDPRYDGNNDLRINIADIQRIVYQ